MNAPAGAASPTAAAASPVAATATAASSPALATPSEASEKKKNKLKSLFHSMAHAVRGDTDVSSAVVAPSSVASDADSSSGSLASTGDEDSDEFVEALMDWRLRGTCACPDQSHRLDLRARGADNWTALHFAARSGSAAIAEELILSCLPLDINAVTKSMWTPLMLAADKGHTAVVELLLKYRADIHAATADGKTAIFLARERNFSSISQRLTEASSTRHLAALKHNPFVSADASHALTTSEEHGGHSGGSGGAEDEDAASPAILSIVHAVQSIKAATEAAIGSSAAGSSSAGGAQDADAVRRAWFSASPLQADLFGACETGDIARVKKLFELSVQAVNNLHATSPAGTPIPAAEVDFFARGIDNWSVMHYAARKNHHKVLVQIVESLVGANVPAKSIIDEINAVTKSGWTALMMAVDRGHVESVRLLLRCGADASIRATNGETALSLLSAYRNQSQFPYALLKDLLEGKRV